MIIFGVIQERLHMARFILQYYLANVFDKWTPLCQLKYSCFTEKKWKEKKKGTAVVEKVSVLALFRVCRREMTRNFRME